MFGIGEEDVHGQLEGLLADAYARRRAGDAAGAMALYRDAADRAGAIGDMGRRAHALRHVGDIAVERGEIAIAVAAAQEAVALYRSIGDRSLNLANALRVAALALEAEARGHWFEARALYAAAGVDAGIAEADARLR